MRRWQEFPGLKIVCSGKNPRFLCDLSKVWWNDYAHSNATYVFEWKSLCSESQLWTPAFHQNKSHVRYHESVLADSETPVVEDSGKDPRIGEDISYFSSATCPVVSTRCETVVFLCKFLILLVSTDEASNASTKAIAGSLPKWVKIWRAMITFRGGALARVWLLYCCPGVLLRMGVLVWLRACHDLIVFKCYACSNANASCSQH